MVQVQEITEVLRIKNVNTFIYQVDLHLSTLNVALLPHHTGKGCSIPLAPKTAKERMKRIT